MSNPSGISRQGIVLDGVRSVFNKNDKGNSNEINFDSSGNSRRHIVKNWFNGNCLGGCEIS